MHGHQERPNTRLERYLIGVLWIAILLVGDQLVLRIYSELDRTHTVEFVSLALLAALALYLAVLFISLATVRYRIADGRLWLRQGLRRVEFDLTGEFHLHRWRSRWAWSGGVVRELGVEAIDHYPPLWLFRPGGVWVVVGTTPAGARRAVALRPSPRLLALLREELAEEWRAGD